MKNSLKLIVLFIILSSCDDNCIESYIAFVNNSGKDIEISSYKRSGVDGKTMIFSKKITIVNNTRNEVKTKDCGKPSSKRSIRAIVEGDSIVIDYGDKTKYHGYTTSRDRNPFLLELSNNSNDFVYTLTPEDYANAIPK